MQNSKKKISLIYFLGFISLGLIASFLGPSLPSFAENTQSSFKQISNLFILSSIGYIIGSYGAGQILNKVQGHRLLAFALFGIAILAALLPLIQQLWVLVSIFLLLGVVQSVVDVSANTLLIWLHGSAVTNYMNGLHFFFGVGTLIAPIIIAQSLRARGNINIGLWVIAAVILVPAILILKYPSPKEPQVNPEKFVDRPQIAATPLVIFLVIMFFGFTGAEITFGNWIYTYSLGMKMADPQNAAYLTSLFWGAFTLSRFLGIILAGKISAKQLMWINLIGCAISILTVIAFHQSQIVLWVGTFFFGFFIANSFPTAMNLAERMGVYSARITSLFFISSSIAVMLSPWVVGQFFESIGPVVVLWAVFINICIAILVNGLIQVYKRREIATNSVLIDNKNV